MTDDPIATTAAALDRLEVGARPLLVVDVDEVVLRFIEPFESFLADAGFRLRPVSYAITGNVTRLGSDRAIPAEEVHRLIEGFFAAHVGVQMPVEGAVAALDRLGRRCDVVLLTNVPPEQAERRIRRLGELGIAHPMVANHGPKGPAMARLAARVSGPIVFVDDGPSNLASVRDHVAGVRLVQFVDDARYYALAPEVAGVWFRTRSWAEVVTRIEALPEIAASAEAVARF